MPEKKAADSLVIMTELVLPNDTNVFGNLMGGRLMYWMDIAAALSAGKHCNAPVVTASVDNISFEAPIKLGNAVHIEAKQKAKACSRINSCYRRRNKALRRSFTPTPASLDLRR